MKIEGSDFYVYVEKLPGWKVGGFCSTNPDGTDTMLINANLPVERWAEIYDHERRHLEHDDLYHDGDVADMERRANDALEYE